MSTLQIDLVEEIGGWGFRLPDLLAQTKGFKGNLIKVPINSFGGSVLEGLSIYNALLGSSPDVETQIIGYAMSMGTIVALAGDTVKMPENGYFMIHEPWTYAIGDSKNMDDTANLLESMADEIAGIYAAKAKSNGKKGKTKKYFRGKMKEETWYNAQEALEEGLVDELTKGADISAKFEIDKFKNIPKQIIDEIQNQKEVDESEKEKEEKMGWFKDLFNKNDDGELVVQEEAKNAFMNEIKPDMEEMFSNFLDKIEDKLEDRFASKADLENLASKDDIKDIVSKDDIKDFVTKDEAFDVTEIQNKLDVLKTQGEANAGAIADIKGNKKVQDSKADSGQELPSAQEKIEGAFRGTVRRVVLAKTEEG